MPQNDPALPTGQPPQGAALVRPLSRLLRPLVRLLLRAGMTFPQAAELLRALYVDVAARDVLTDRRERTDSRLSLLTGVHRKEIRRLREQGVDVAETPAAVTLNSQIVSRWLGTPGYQDASGRPLALPRATQMGPAKTGGAPSFEALVRSVTTDLRARAVLDEWLRLGIVRLEPDGTVALAESAFVPRAGHDPAQDDAALYYFGRNLHDHIAASAANIGGGSGPGFLDLSLNYGQLSAGSAALLRREGAEAARRLLLDLNRRAQALAEADAASGGTGPTQRINLGVYLYAEDDTPGAAA